MSVRFVFGSSTIYFTVVMAERAASLLLVPLTTRALTPADYGVLLLVTNCAAAVNLPFGFALAQALPTLFTHASSDAERRAVGTTILLSIAAILGLIYLCAAMFASRISLFFLGTTNYANAIELGALASFSSACVLCLALLVRLTERHKLYLMVQLPTLTLQTLLIVLLVGLGLLSLSTLYIATATASLFALAVYATALRRWLNGRFEATQLAKAGRIAAQMLMWQLAILLTTNSAAFFLNHTGHLEDAGLFLVASNAAAVLIATSTSIENVWTPFVLLRKDQPELGRVQVRIFSLYSAALLVVAAGLSLFAHELFVILIGPAFRDAYRFVPALCLCYCIFCFANAFAQGLQARERTVHYSWIGIAVSAVFLVLALILPPLFGVWGIIAAMGAGFAVMLLLLQLVSSRLMPVAYPWGRHCVMWLVAIAIVLFVYPLDISWTAFAAKIATMVGIVALPFVFGVVRGSDLGLAKQALLTAIR